MANLKYKMIVLDLDGTLVNNKKEITFRNKKTLIRAQQEGVKVVLASGRPTQGIVPLADDLELFRYGGYILSYNGGKIIEYPNRKIIYESVLPPSVIPELYGMAKEQDVTIISYDDKEIITENPGNKYVQIESRLNNMKIKEVNSFVKAIDFPVTKCLIVGDGDILEPLTEIMKVRFGDRMNIYRSEPFFLELMPQHIDKAYSLGKLAEYTGISSEEMIACGDGFNDLSMVCFAGLGVAMSNAQPAVKEAADYITGSNEEDGVAQVVEKFILEI